jgi:hypothetical protein
MFCQGDFFNPILINAEGHSTKAYEPKNSFHYIACFRKHLQETGGFQNKLNSKL